MVTKILKMGNYGLHIHKYAIFELFTEIFHIRITERKYGFSQSACKQMAVYTQTPPGKGCKMEHILHRVLIRTIQTHTYSTKQNTIA